MEILFCLWVRKKLALNRIPYPQWDSLSLSSPDSGSRRVNGFSVLGGQRTFKMGLPLTCGSTASNVGPQKQTTGTVPRPCAWYHLPPSQAAGDTVDDLMTPFFLNPFVLSFPDTSPPGPPPFLAG